MQGQDQIICMVFGRVVRNNESCNVLKRHNKQQTRSIGTAGEVRAGERETLSSWTLCLWSEDEFWMRSPGNEAVPKLAEL